MWYVGIVGENNGGAIDELYLRSNEKAASELAIELFKAEIKEYNSEDLTVEYAQESLKNEKAVVAEGRVIQIGEVKVR